MTISGWMDQRLPRPRDFFSHTLSFLQIGSRSLSEAKQCRRVSSGSKPLSWHSCTAQLCFSLPLGTAGLALLVGTSFHHYIATCSPCQHVTTCNQSLCIHEVLGNPFPCDKSLVGATAEVLKPTYMQTHAAWGAGRSKWRCTSSHRSATWLQKVRCGGITRMTGVLQRQGASSSGETTRKDEEGDVHGMDQRRQL